jgi:hypothetical protein
MMWCKYSNSQENSIPSKIFTLTLEFLRWARPLVVGLGHSEHHFPIASGSSGKFVGRSAKFRRRRKVVPAPCGEDSSQW